MLHVLVWLADSEGCAWPGKGYLSDSTGYEPRTIQRVVQRLEAAGWLVVTRRKYEDVGRHRAVENMTNLYRIVLPKHPEEIFSEAEGNGAANGSSWDAVVAAWRAARGTTYGMPTAIGDTSRCTDAQRASIVAALSSLSLELGETVEQLASALLLLWVRERRGRADFLVSARHPLERLADDLDWAASELVRRRRRRSEASSSASSSAATQPAQDAAHHTRAVLEALSGGSRR